MDNLQKHYMYRITNIILKKYYYGVRSCYIEPKKDLGHKYFSSSTDKLFIQDQKRNPKNYEYKIIRCFKTRKSAELFETKLHTKFQVQIHEAFYNKAINTNMGFSVVGTKQTPEHTAKIVKHSKGKTYEERYGKERAEEIKNKLRNRIVSDETRKKLSETRKATIASEETRRAISNGIKKRYTKPDFLASFSETMAIVNRDPEKRKKAGQKIKEKWNDQEYLEKMKQRPHVSNSKALKEKWNDTEWRHKVLKSRTEKNRERMKLFDVFDATGKIVHSGITIAEANKIWNKLHLVTKDKPLGSTRQSLKFLENKDSLHLKGYYSKESE